MSVTSTTNRKSYAGDAVTTSFATNPVVFFDSSDLAVSVISAAGVETALTENTHYTVTGGDGSTGTVNTAGGSAPYGAPAAGVTLLILRVVALTQPVDFVQNDGSDAEVQETAYDRLTMMVQQLNEVDSRAIKLPTGEAGSAAMTELPVDRASKFLAFDASKNLIASSGTVGGTVPVSAFMETVLDDATAADARTTLGAAGSGAVTGSGLTMSTARILGRTTASTGAVDEITVGTGLTLSGGALSASAASDSAAGIIEIAIQSEMEAASSNTLAVTPGRMRFHPGVCKGWINADGSTAAANASYNVSGTTDASSGIIWVSWDTDFSSANHVTIAMLDTNGINLSPNANVLQTTIDVIESRNTASGALTDPRGYCIAAFGDFA